MSVESDQAKRTYRKRRRAEQEAETRERITVAAVKLHGTVGPARTTVSGVAAEAGVQRATVYRHFPDEEALFGACTAHYFARHPPPDFTTWVRTHDPVARLRHALAEVYDFYEETEEMLERTSRDVHLVPAMAAAEAGFLAMVEQMRAALVKGRPERGHARRRVEAVIGHALGFATWQSLARQAGLSNEEVVELMAATVVAAGALSLGR